MEQRTNLEYDEPEKALSKIHLIQSNKSRIVLE